MLPRIMIVAHGHPSSIKGGAEIAAYNFFKEFKRQGAECLFVARSEPNRPMAARLFRSLAMANCSFILE